MAKTYLEQAAASNLPGFLKALSEIIVQPQYSDVARMAAGLQLKNHLTSKDAKIKQNYTERWLQFPPDIREYIKDNVSDPDETVVWLPHSIPTQTHRQRTLVPFYIPGHKDTRVR